MNWDDIKDDWAHARQRAKAEWSKLKDEDLDRIDGNRTLLMETSVERYNLSLEEAGLEVDHCAEQEG